MKNPVLLSLAFCCLFIGASSADLLVHYAFDTQNGTVVENSGTLATDGTVVGGATYGAGQSADFGTAFYGNRNGSNDGWVETGLFGTDVGMGSNTDSYTVMAWINWLGASGQVDHMVFGADDGNPEGNAAQLHHGIRDDSVDNIHFGGWGGTQDIADAGAVPAGIWTHVAWQFDGSGIGEAVVFLNGAEVARQDKNNITDPALALLIGGHTRDGTLANRGHSFNGAIDDVKMFDAALNAVQVQQAMQPGQDSDGDGLTDSQETTVHMTDPLIADTDGDGIDDGLELAFELDPLSSVGDDGAAGDPDADGLSNLDELNIHMTQPNVADTDSDTLSDGDEVNTHGTNPLLVDSDGDTLTDADEITIYMTDPVLLDTDIDGLEDGTEVANMLDPLSAVGDDGASGDPDGDALTNIDELLTHMTDPQVADTDMDGLNDGAEITTHFTDPLVVDSDGDTLSDGDEVLVHMTNPNLEDTDGDAFTDAAEVAASTDPNDAASFPSGLPFGPPLLYYTFNLDNGTTVENIGSLATAGTLIGGATYGASVDDTFGSAFYGNRTSANDAYVQTAFAGDALGMGAGGVYTAMAWISWVGGSGSVDHMVFGQEDGPGNNAQLHHGIRDDAAGNNIHFGGWGGAQDLSDGGAVPPDGTWTHVAWQYDGTDKVVFVNGVETARAVGNNISAPALNVIIGGHGRDAADPAGQSFNGALDEVKVYGEVLTAAEIQAAMIPTAASSSLFQITDIQRNFSTEEITLTFTSAPGVTYSSFYTEDLRNAPTFLEIDDNIAGTPMSGTTTVTFPTPEIVIGAGAPPDLFFVIRKN